MKYEKNIKNYALWGIIAAFVNIGMFQALLVLDVDYKTANISALLFNRFFCYVTNKYFVFKTRCSTYVDLIREMASFFAARIVTFLIDYFGVCLLVEVMKLEALVSKLIVAFIVIVANYLFSAFFVFKKEKIGGEK